MTGGTEFVIDLQPTNIEAQTIVTRLTARSAEMLGSARVSRAGDSAPAIANFSAEIRDCWHFKRVDCGEAPQSAREARALPGINANSCMIISKPDPKNCSHLDIGLS